MKVGDAYGFRVEGPWQPNLGHRFDVSKLLIDPFAFMIDRPYIYRPELTQRNFDTAALVPKAIVCPPLPDLPLRKITRPKMIYELGVKSFTKLNPDVAAEIRGTISALAEPAIIAHLQALHVDTIELMPINPWIDERHLVALGLHNAWGYNSVQFGALDPRLAPGGLQELRDTIAVLHDNGIQVILDVVFNHSGESDQFGPSLSFRGLDNASYYAQTDGELHNDSGCGNTLALNQPAAMDMVLQTLRNFVLKCGVDGFRFDLATTLGRTQNGFEKDAPLLKAIEADTILNSRILIAEPWDVGPGGYQLGNFPPNWFEWNDQYRDDVRKFWRGDGWAANHLATRLSGSSDIFQSRTPSASVNFVAAHDGFTLRDLVTYQAKQNLANGEHNRDGNASEVTWPKGDVRALLATLFLSRGTIMLTAGDEFGRSQKGNNNAYAQDNDSTWLQWRDMDLELLAFVRSLGQLRKRLEFFFSDDFLTAETAFWFDQLGEALDWSKSDLHYVGLKLSRDNRLCCIILNRSMTDFPTLPKCLNGPKLRLLFNSRSKKHVAAQSVTVFMG